MKNATQDPVETDARRLVMVFVVHDQRFALPFEAVERVTRAVAITRVPDSSPEVLGVVNVGGSVLPVVALRRRLGFPDRVVRPGNHLIITKLPEGRVILLVDKVEGVQEVAEHETALKGNVFPDTCAVNSVATLQNDIVLICDVERFLSDPDFEWTMEAACLSDQ